MSTARVLCPACNHEYTLAAGVAVNSETRCPRCGKTGVPMFLHEQGGGSGLAVALVLGCLGMLALCFCIAFALAAYWFLRAAPDAPQAPPMAGEVPVETAPLPPPDPAAPDGLRMEPPASRPAPTRPTPPRLPRLTDAPGQGAESDPPADRPPRASGSVPPPKPPRDNDPTRLRAMPPAGEPLRYGWDRGDSRHYTFRIEARIDDGRVHSSGSVIYTLVATPDETDAALPREEGGGSAFVVSAQGHLVTCAHVVKNATDVQVQLGEQTYEASILAADQQRDLALLQIQAEGLQPLRLGESSQVELAQDVRVIGYPLSDVLGTSVKVTRGIVAGFVDQDREPLLQIDAGINPGNSGGPLLDAAGRVIGVASAKLAGEAISNIGFAVPVDDVKRLLDARQVECPRSEGGGRVLSGPELARQVSPGVALLKVRTGPGGFAATQRLSVRFSGSVTTRADSRAGLRRDPFGARLPSLPAPPRLSTPEHDRGQLLLDVYGEILESDGEQSLPFLLGPLATMVFEPLGGPDRQSWQQRRGTLIRHVRKPESSFSGFPRPPRLRIPGPYGPRFSVQPEPQEETIAEHSAIEHTAYEIVRNTDDLWTIHKEYRLETVDAEPTEGAPVLSLVGEGRFRFDRRVGAPLDQEFEATLTVDSRDATLRIPVTFRYELFAPEELAEGRPPLRAGAESGDASGAAEAASRDAEPVAAEPLPPRSPQEIAALVDDLESGDRQACRAALTALAGVEADEHQPRVVGRLKDLLSSEDLYTRITAARALQGWGSSEAVPALVQRLDDPNIAVRQYAVAALAAIGDAAAAEAIVARWKRLPGMGLPALSKIGAAAEGAALQLLAHEDPAVRADGCRVLARIGTDRSREPLEARGEDASAVVQKAAEAALQQVRGRLEGGSRE